MKIKIKKIFLQSQIQKGRENIQNFKFGPVALIWSNEEVIYQNEGTFMNKLELKILKFNDL